MDRPEDPQLLTEGPPGKSEQDLGIGRPAHLTRGQVPFPGGDLGDLERHPQTLLVLADALVRPVQRGGPLLDPELELLIRQLQRLPGLSRARTLPVAALR